MSNLTDDELHELIRELIKHSFSSIDRIVFNDDIIMILERLEIYIKFKF